MAAPEKTVFNVSRGAFVLLAVAVLGLFQVKWSPYYHRAFVAATTHAIGSSILMGSADAPPAPSWSAAVDYALAYGKSIWQAMLLGLVLGSGIQAALPRRWITRLLGRTGYISAVAGGLLALPGMMCTCCAAPMVEGLRRQQATPGAAIAFWLGNTLLNPATLVFIGLVLGWQWTALRLGFGLVLVFGLGIAVNRMARPEAIIAPPVAEPDGPGTGLFLRWGSILARMALRLLPEYLVLVLLLGCARAWLFPHIGSEVDNSLIWILCFTLAGLLFVIPTAGEVPIIQAMLALGIGVGPAGALLITLPPISLPSLAMLVPAFPSRLLAVVTLAVAMAGMLSGLLAVGLGF